MNLTQPFKLYIGADHRGFKKKALLIKKLSKIKNITCIDLGTYSDKELDDYNDIAKKVCIQLKRDTEAQAILICGSGMGMIMAANRYNHIRAALGYDAFLTRMSRRDENSNVLAFSGEKQSVENMFFLTKLWLRTPFYSIPRYKRRINKLTKSL